VQETSVAPVVLSMTDTSALSLLLSVRSCRHTGWSPSHRSREPDPPADCWASSRSSSPGRSRCPDQRALCSSGSSRSARPMRWRTSRSRRCLPALWRRSSRSLRSLPWPFFARRARRSGRSLNSARPRSVRSLRSLRSCRWLLVDHLGRWPRSLRSSRLLQRFRRAFGSVAPVTASRAGRSLCSGRSCHSSGPVAPLAPVAPVGPVAPVWPVLPVRPGRACRSGRPTHALRSGAPRRAGRPGRTGHRVGVGDRCFLPAFLRGGHGEGAFARGGGGNRASIGHRAGAGGGFRWVRFRLPLRRSSWRR